MAKRNSRRDRYREPMQEGTVSGTLGCTTLLVATLGLGYVATQYSDCGEYRNGTSRGTAKNALSVLVTGIVAQHVPHKTGTIDVTAEKYFWPDAHITGKITPYAVDASAYFLSSKVNYHGWKNKQGMIEGDVQKNGFDWHVIQTDKDTYAFKALWYMPNGGMTLAVENGHISGSWRERYRNTWDVFSFGYRWRTYEILGRYDDSGNVQVTIDTKDPFDVFIKGEVAKR